MSASSPSDLETLVPSHPLPAAQELDVNLRGESMPGTPDYYAILGVKREATTEQITIAFNQQVERFPADERDPATNPRFRQLVMAYRILSNPESRAAFDQAYEVETKPGTTKALQIQLFPSQNPLPVIDEIQILYLLLDIGANPALLDQRPPINLSLVVDRSTSMAGERINRVKAAASVIAERLEPDDTISVIAFSDFAEVIVPSESAANVNLIKSRISQISTGGATEIQQGLRLGLLELSKTSDDSAINHLVLLTDGHTYGDEADSVRLAQQAAGSGVSISALGIGHEWNDVFLDDLVSASGGTASYLESSEQVITHLEGCVRGLGRAFAHGLQLAMALPPRFEARSIHKLSPALSAIQWSYDAMPLGTLQHGLPLMVLVELGVHPHTAGMTAELGVEVKATVIPTRQRSARFTREIEIEFMHDPPVRMPPPAVIRAVNKLNLYRLNERVWQDVEDGAVEQAARRMEALATRLHEAGETRLAQTALREAKNIARTGHLSPEGRKELKYGTRSLISYDHVS
jgi:Ca-activated chloride channel family protein